MKAAVLKSPQILKVADIPRFRPEPGGEPQVVIKVGACGVCGSDLRYYKGENPWALHTLGRSVPNPPNIVLGHEYAGTVVEVGDSRYEGLMNARVAVLCFLTCGSCDACRSGNENLCKNTIHMGHGAGWGKRDYYPGGMAEYALAWARGCYVLPDEITFEEAAMLDVLGVGLHAAKRGRISPGRPVLVMGSGPIGSAIAQSARALGAGKIIVTDIYDKALDIARETGIDIALNAQGLKARDIATMVLDATGGEGVAAAFDTVGTPETLQTGLTALAETGILVNLAVHSGKLDLETLQLSSERTITTSCNFYPSEYGETLRLLQAGYYNVKPWITHRFPLDEVPRAFDVLFHKSEYGAYKAVIKPDQ